MNIDAAFSPDMVQGGAILRTRSGDFVLMMIFKIEALSCEEAELKVMIQAAEMIMEEGYDDVQVETDAVHSISTLFNDLGNTTAIQNFRRKALDRGFCFTHVYREGNNPVHYLAAHKIHSAKVRFERIDLLPNTIKSAYYADLFNILSLHF
ncbi:unnamed protein product [Cuscuta epithymum]|uniref:RNase H type-1 domain-containing protein n=1 Tax=Cuscuta epithymum TaxID=186058 RepID=A0AAV0FIA7_9ASTE|nr:unnamed protein product [Cuscuta epithymum]